MLASPFLKNFLYGLIILIASLAISGSFGLVIKESDAGNICPKILGIPACYIVLTCFTLALIGHLIPRTKGKWIYFFFIGIVTFIATMGTIGELTGMIKCPRTTGGTPMCFLSLAICLSLLVSKIALIRSTAKK